MNKYRLRRIGVASNASATSPSLSDCIELLLGQVDALAADVLTALKTFVALPAAVPEAEREPSRVEKAVAHLLAESEAVRATLSAELRRMVYQSGSYDFAQSPLGRVEDIHLFDIRELESHIEMALARQEVMRAVDDVLPLFDSLVTALLGWSTVQPSLNPLKPDAFIRALNDTLQAWVPDEGPRMELLRPASIALGIGMRQLYRETCDWLRSQGVEPVDQATGKPPGGAVARSQLAETEVERTMTTLDKLRRLLAGEPLLAPGGAGSRDFTHTVPASLVALQDLRLVEPMMKRLAERSAPPPVQAGFSPVRAVPAVPLVRSQAQNQQIGRQLGDEVVRMMLDQLAQDERMVLPVRAQLRVLEPVLARLAKSDPRFFIDRAHPARQLLDRVAQRSLLFARDHDDSDGEGILGFVACVAYAVNTLVQGPGDAEAFAGVLEALEQDWTAFEAMRRRQREDALNARQHAEQRMLLAQRFSGAMMERFKNSGLPELVASFLRGPWSQVLAEVHLRNTTAEPDPRAYLALVDDLVWSVHPPLVRLDYSRLVRLIPRLLARLNEGLVLIRYPREPVSIFLDDLSALHEKALEEHRRALAAARASAAVQSGSSVESAAGEVAPPMPPMPPTPMPMPPMPPAPPGDDATLPLGQARPRVRHIAKGPSAPRDLMLGSSVDLLLGGAWVRAELTWISHNRNLFMFISGAGLAHAMSRRTMDRLETQGRIRVVAAVVEVDLELEDLVGDAPDSRQGDRLDPPPR